MKIKGEVLAVVKWGDAPGGKIEVKLKGAAPRLQRRNPLSLMEEMMGAPTRKGDVFSVPVSDPADLRAFRVGDLVNVTVAVDRRTETILDVEAQPEDDE